MVDTESVVVVIEDDPHISDLIELYLRRDGFRVYQATDGTRGLEVITERRPDLVVLDIGLPGDIDGLEVCRRIRAGARTPVIFLTARDDEIDRIVGLELGADDYVTKPFSPRELVARVKAVLRRSGTEIDERPPVHELGGLSIDTGRREARRGDEVIVLAAQEFDLLVFLLDNPGLAMTRRQLLDGAWGRDWVGDERTVDVHVRQLRRKLGDDLPLETVWGVGYRLG
jgi:DNA-binding response OmpR family regulator